MADATLYCALWLAAGCSSPEIVEQPGTLFVEPGLIDFGVVEPPGFAIETAIVSNVGNGPLTVDRQWLDNPDGPFSIAGLPPGPIAPGESREMAILYAPETTAFVTDAAWFSPQGETGGNNVRLVGGLSAGDIVIEPPEYDFGTVNVGDVEEVELFVMNRGTAPGTVLAADYSSENGWMSLSSPGAFSDLPVVIEPADVHAVAVTFAPTGENLEVGTLSLTVEGDGDEPLLVEAWQAGVGQQVETIFVEIELTSDDTFEAFLDGNPLPQTSSTFAWNEPEVISFTVPVAEHVFALHAWDNGQVIAGFVARIYVDGQLVDWTGSGSWKVTGTEPAADWATLGFDDSSWGAPIPCTDPSVWGSAVDLDPAVWVWPRDCEALGEAWFRISGESP